MLLLGLPVMGRLPTKRNNFKESYNTSLDEAVVYIGTNKLSDSITFDVDSKPFTTSIGKLILSPTRTYAPVLKILLENAFDKIHGLIHCSGGGQTKCMKYLPGNFRIVKDNLFEAPEIFKLIKDSSGSNSKEMYEVFNMGCRLEVYCEKENAQTIIETAQSFGITAQIIGRVEESNKKELLIKIRGEEISY